jgi:sugar diacid utilization regulator
MAREWPVASKPATPTDHDLMRQENLLLRELVTVYQRLTGLALQNAEVATVVQLLAQRTSATVAVVSQSLEVVTAAGPGGPDDKVTEYVAGHLASPRISGVLRSTAQTRRSLRLPHVGDGAGLIVAPILVGDDVPAYLLTFGDADDSSGDLSLLVTEHAATICGVMLSRERVVAAAARQVRDDLVEGLLLGGREGDVARWARHLGYDPGVPHRVLAVALGVALDPGAAVRAADGSAVVRSAGAERTTGERAVAERVAVAIEQFFAVRAADAITSIRSDEVIVVIPEQANQRADGAEIGRLATSCVERIRDMFPETAVSVGIGGICRDPAEIATSYGQARRTIDAMARLGRHGHVLAFDDLGIHRLLLLIPDLAELSAFASEVLGKLAAMDRQRGTEFVATLACYFRENNSPQRTARTLHVHPNTVTYRIRRICEITGLQLDVYRDRMLAQVALEVIDALGTDRAGPRPSSGSTS